MEQNTSVMPAALHPRGPHRPRLEATAPVPILEAPRHGCLNVHASLLPRWRGAAPIQRAILAGDEVTGVCIMAMERGLDTGAVYARRETAIDGKTAGELTAELAAMGGSLMADVLERIREITPEPQPEEGVTYAHKIDKAEALLNFTETAERIERRIRAFSPVPGAYFELGGERIRVLKARVVPLGGDPGLVVDDELTIGCQTEAIWPETVQRAGRAPMNTEDFLRGFPVPRYTFIDGYPAYGYE